MPKLSDVCRHIRSKNAGPFWITVDLFFKDKAAFHAYADSQQLRPDAIGRIYGVDSEFVKCFPVPDLDVLKISYPRNGPQGGVVERDLHGGQQYIRLVDVELD